MPDPKDKITTVRMGDGERAVITMLATKLARSESQVVRELIPSEYSACAYLDLARVFNLADPMQARVVLESEGMRRLAEISDFPLSAALIDSTPPGEMARVFLEWRDGVASHLKCRGPMGNIFKLEQVEDGYRPVRDKAWMPRPITLAPRTVDEMLAGLRSGDFEERMSSALFLAKSFAAGLKLANEDSLDVEHIVGPSFLDLLERAVGGDAEAVDELAKVITVDPTKARRPDVHESRTSAPSTERESEARR